MLGGGALIILIFFMFVLGRGDSYKLLQRTIRTQPVANIMVSDEMNVMLSSQNNSNESGIATLKETNGRVTVTLYLTGYVPNVVQPAHIHAGICPGVGGISYPLNSVVNGKSTTVLGVTLTQLKQQSLAINVHKSATDIATYTSCGAL